MSEYADGFDDGKGEKFDELMVEIVALREQLKEAQFSYERGFDDGFILRKEKDEGAKSEYICTCGIRVTPHKCPTDNDF